MSEVRAADPSEVDAVAGILVEAFQDDPVSRWVFPDAERRRAVSHPAFFGALLGAGFATGHVDVTADLTAAVIWLPASEGDDEPVVGLDRAEADRLGVLLGLMAGLEPPGPLWHAQFVGVRPGHQGRGIGGRLLRHGLDRADAEGVPTYLKAGSPDSTRLYRRLGFRDHGPAFRPPGGPPMQPMRRAPA
ncbi:GNAT family N-acetyltransferase [Amycolatopsis mongoliensis]|uniref:GNAT family N-acetyltransferase n=1 Tax=Amycolatopsis mongoliensis TaxID=715475 RepID=A0A9Y2K035_9PSEU|nr:GNAT family N-acetyltransferase [Amycolatopsis sp. 4-36]WIY06786.1 GNAT family N-acetyltransferase [Amycolatopsis sp. 4-36]